MKKIISLLTFLTFSLVGFAQGVDNFEVGPYEVDYKGPGDFKFRIRKDIDLYEYFGLTRDTIIEVTEQPVTPIYHGIQINAFMSMPRYVANGVSNVWGVDGSWKQRIGQLLYLNAGLSFGMSFGKYGAAYMDYPDWKDGGYSETMVEIGVPLSLELSKLNHTTASLYGSVGVIPTYYTGGKNAAGESKSGFMVAPRIDVGGYLPLGKQIVRLGGFAQYDINCSGGDDDIFKERIGRLFLGANIGLVF